MSTTAAGAAIRPALSVGACAANRLRSRLSCAYDAVGFASRAQMKLFPGLLTVAAFAALTVASWALLNRPIAEPAWPARDPGICVLAISPGRGSHPARVSHRCGDRLRPEAAGREDQRGAHLQRRTARWGTFRSWPSATGSMSRSAPGSTITATATGAQLEVAIELARAHINVMRVFIGNEVVLRGDLPIRELEEYLDRARDAIGQPVGTAEPWHVWLAHPELAQHVDFIGVHLLPYWEGVPVTTAVEYSLASVSSSAEGLPGQAGGDRRGRLAQPWPDAPVGGGLGCERGAVSAAVPHCGPSESTSSII